MELYFHSLVSLAEARFAASTHPKFMGFSFSTHSPHHISPIDYIKIRAWLSCAEKVAQFLYEPISSIQKSLDSLQIEWIEIPADHPEIEALSRLYKLITVKGDSPMAQYTRSKLLTDTTAIQHNVFYEIENSTKSSDFIKLMQPYGIALSGGRKETEPGMTDLSEWMDLMEELDIH